MRAQKNRQAMRSTALASARASRSQTQRRDLITLLRARYGLAPLARLRLLSECEKTLPDVDRAARYFLRSGAKTLAPKVSLGLSMGARFNANLATRLEDRPSQPLFLFSASSEHGSGKPALWNRLRELGADPLAMDEAGAGFEHVACRMKNTIEGLRWWRDQGYPLDRRDGAGRTVWSHALSRGPMALELTKELWPEGFSWKLTMDELYELKEALARWAATLTEETRACYAHPAILVSGIGAEINKSIEAILNQPESWEWVRPGDALSSYIEELRGGDALVALARQAERLASARAERMEIEKGLARRSAESSGLEQKQRSPAL